MKNEILLVEDDYSLAGALRHVLKLAVKLSGGNQVRAARWPGISRLTLRQRLRNLGLIRKMVD
jgi:DNA-binding protein Fis